MEVKMNAFSDVGGFHYCASCADEIEIDDREVLNVSDFPNFTPCAECGDDVFDRDIECDFIAIDREEMIRWLKIVLSSQKETLDTILSRSHKGTSYKTTVHQTRDVLDASLRALNLWRTHGIAPDVF
jgi:predicted RNA-binding Zn-ribbon protein involved in translation (DUF1610 family)